VARILPPHQVYIDGVRDDGWPESCYFLIGTAEGWQVGGQERGRLHVWQTFADESAACRHLFDVYAKEEFWPVVEPLGAVPVPWTPRMRAGAVQMAQNFAQPLITRVAASPRQRLRVALEPSFALDAVRDRPDTLRPASNQLEPPASYALLEGIVVDASVAADGELDLRLSDADATGRSVEQLASSGVLRRIAIVDDPGHTRP
jgi:hypothetical protein